MEDIQELKRLFRKYLANECSEEEVNRLLPHLRSVEKNHLFEEIIGENLTEDIEDGFADQPHIRAVLDDARKKIVLRIGETEDAGEAGVRSLWPRIISVAAAVILCICAAAFIFNYTPRKENTVSKAVPADIAPGGNKAVLTLADGSKISLTDATNGTLAKQSGISVTKTADGQITYVIAADQAASDGTASTPEAAMNTISTPKGGQYNVVLPDGSKIWLNAASSVRYPVKFNPAERRVVLSGEAYFEVNPARSLIPGQARVPFIVETGDQEVEVLGTHFNINGYTDEPLVKTTLLEGKVRVRKNGTTGTILSPGQQAQASARQSNIRVVTADIKAEMAWKHNQFFFEDEPIETIMRQISRWYDVDIVYKDDLKGKTVWGSVTRFSNISKVLNILELTGNVHFKIEGRQVIVMK